MRLRPGSTLDPAAAAYRAFPDVLARLEEIEGKGRKRREREGNTQEINFWIPSRSNNTTHNTMPRHVMSQTNHNTRAMTPVLGEHNYI